MFCPKCGIKNPDDADFCENCGQQLKTAQSRPIVKPVNDSPQPKKNIPSSSSQNRKPSSVVLVLGYIFAFLGGIIGLIFGVYLFTRKNTQSKFHGRNMLIIAAVIMVISLASTGLLLNNFAPGVFATELNEEQVQDIINNVVNEGITDPSERATIGRPIRVTINGVRSWRVPVTYDGNNPTRRSRLNGDITLPVRLPEEEGNLVVPITFADGTTMEVVVSPDGVVVTIKTPGVLPSPQEVNEAEPEEQTQTSTQNQQATQSQQKPTQSQQQSGRDGPQYSPHPYRWTCRYCGTVHDRQGECINCW